MDTLLILGGTAWLGREMAQQAVAAGVAVTCLARGEAGPAAQGVELVVADRDRPDAYDAVRTRAWDAVIDVSWQPDRVRSALDALGAGARHWTYVSSASVYADTTTPGADESAALVDPLRAGPASPETYGEAKAGCEALVSEATPSALLARVGLIGGPGDPTDRFGYWVSRFALAGTEPVLVPDVPDLSVQLVDVRDLASFLLGCADAGATGPVDVMGEAMPFPDVIAAAAESAGFSGRQVLVGPDWLIARGVEPWSGPRSLPLWLPLPEFAGMMDRSVARAVSLGLARRPLAETTVDVLVDERARGLARDRRAGLSRAEELALLLEVR